MVELVAHTDGACSGNPGPGGWGVLLEAKQDGAVVKERELSGGEAETTNNRMEMMAVIRALQALKRPCHVTVHTDSSYVMKGITEWIDQWKRRNWRTAARKPVKNVDLWKQLEQALDGHETEWVWVKGHSGVPENERADELARLAIPRGKQALESGN